MPGTGVAVGVSTKIKGRIETRRVAVLACRLAVRLKDEMREAGRLSDCFSKEDGGQAGAAALILLRRMTRRLLGRTVVL